MQDSTVKYKAAADLHRQDMDFSEGDSVLVYFRKERFLVGSNSKLGRKKFGLFKILKKLGKNTYLIDLLSEVSTSPLFQC